jgi:hypothetical protein
MNENVKKVITDLPEVTIEFLLERLLEQAKKDMEYVSLTMEKDGEMVFKDPEHVTLEIEMECAGDKMGRLYAYIAHTVEEQKKLTEERDEALKTVEILRRRSDELNKGCLKSDYVDLQGKYDETSEALVYSNNKASGLEDQAQVLAKQIYNFLFHEGKKTKKQSDALLKKIANKLAKSGGIPVEKQP